MIMVAAAAAATMVVTVMMPHQNRQVSLDRFSL
jgi:hypothetical protein